MDMGKILTVFNSMKNNNLDGGSSNLSPIVEESKPELIDYLNSALGYLADDDLKTAISTLDEALDLAPAESGYKHRINKIIDYLVAEDIQLGVQYLRELIRRVSLKQVEKPIQPITSRCELIPFPPSSIWQSISNL